VLFRSVQIGVREAVVLVPLNRKQKGFNVTRRKVLIVDDSAISLGHMKQLADEDSSQTLDFVMAESGEEALEFVSTDGPFHYAFVDVHLPGMSGFKMLETMRASDPEAYEDMRVFMMCSDGPNSDHGHDESHDHSDACDSLYLSWLVKPIDIALIRRFLLSDVQIQSLAEADPESSEHRNIREKLFADKDHLTEKQIQALEYLVQELTQPKNS